MSHDTALRRRTIGRLLQEAATAAPGSSALVAPSGTALTYEALRTKARGIGSALAEMGIEPGEAVAVVTSGEVEAAVAFLGVAAHAACAPLNPRYGAAELEFYLGDLGAAAVIVGPDLDTPVDRVAGDLGIPVLELDRISGDSEVERREIGNGRYPEPDDVALLLHTSGTTSRPKLVPLTQANLLASAGNVADSLDLGPDDRCLDLMPLFHVHGLVAGLLAPLLAGGSVVCATRLVPEAFLDWLETLEPTWLTGVPTMYHAILGRLEDGGGARARASRVRFARSSSSALAPSLLAAIEEAWQIPVLEAYGMTEASHQISTNPPPPATRRPGSVGLQGATLVAVVGPGGEPLSTGDVGEIVIRGEAVTAGYRSPAEANAEAFRDGWFRTGDLGWVDDAGYLHLQGRLKELINRGGEKVAPREVDEVVLTHPAVAQAVAFALPHPTLGEDLAVAVVPRPGATIDPGELRTYAAERLARFKVPHRVVVVEEIPKGPTGKLQRIGLWKALGLSAHGAEETRDTGRPPSGPAEFRLAELWREILKLEEVGAEEDFYGLGGDSLRATELLRAVELDFGRLLDPAVFLQDPTVAGMARALEGAPQGASS